MFDSQKIILGNFRVRRPSRHVKSCPEGRLTTEESEDINRSNKRLYLNRYINLCVNNSCQSDVVVFLIWFSPINNNIYTVHLLPGQQQWGEHEPCWWTGRWVGRCHSSCVQPHTLYWRGDSGSHLWGNKHTGCCDLVVVLAEIHQYCIAPCWFVIEGFLSSQDW